MLFYGDSEGLLGIHTRLGGNEGRVKSKKIKDFFRKLFLLKIHFRFAILFTSKICFMVQLNMFQAKISALEE